VSPRIGIDARAAAEVPAGKGRYVRELLRAFAARDDDHTYVLYGREPWEGDFDDRFSWWLKALPDAFWHRKAAREANRSCDVFLATASYVTPWFLQIPTALVVHDLVAFRPDVHPPARAAAIERLTLRRAVARSTRIVCDSESTRRDLVARFPGAATKAVAIPLAVRREFGEPLPAAAIADARRRHDLEAPFVLSVGTLEPRKNLAAVFEAYAALPVETKRRWTLAVVGPEGWEYDEILRRAQDVQAKLLGRVPDGDLIALYQSCDLFCYPSLYEGFGLPVLEALAAGAPTITSKVSSLPEVGGDAVRYVDPRDVTELAAVTRELLASPEERQRLASAGRDRAASFSWERTADATLAQLSAAMQ
jgi:alpha-1,3-rhamnosyl/mannosyltransferase